MFLIALLYHLKRAAIGSSCTCSDLSREQPVVASQIPSTFCPSSLPNRSFGRKLTFEDLTCRCAAARRSAQPPEPAFANYRDYFRRSGRCGRQDSLAIPRRPHLSTACLLASPRGFAIFRFSLDTAGLCTVYLHARTHRATPKVIQLFLNSSCRE